MELVQDPKGPVVGMWSKNGKNQTSPCCHPCKPLKADMVPLWPMPGVPGRVKADMVWLPPRSLQLVEEEHTGWELHQAGGVKGLAPS